VAPSWAERFAPFEGVAYLDAASQGPIPLAASRAGREALALKERPWRITTPSYVSAVAEARALAARLLGAREESVALVTGAGQVVNAAARGLDLGEGDEVVLARHEFPSNDLPWRWLVRRGVALRVVEPDHPAGAVSAERLAEAVGPRTRVVAFSHVSYLHGGRLDPGPVVDAARRFGAITVVDGSQAAGALPFDFGASGVDVYAAAAYKFLNWWSVTGAEGFQEAPGQVELKPGAQRYDAHEPASFFNLYPLAESLRLLLEVTPAAVQAHARTLGDRLLARLPGGFSPASPLEPSARSHILCLRGQTGPATAEAFERLRAAKVWASLRADRIRVAPHLYSTAEDIDRLVAALGSGA
jgi:selenocysteine lyase/cysteine desulfurase